MEFDSIKDELLDLLNNAYAPYSNFKVASIVVMKDGKTFKGNYDKDGYKEDFEVYVEE